MKWFRSSSRRQRGIGLSLIVVSLLSAHTEAGEVNREVIAMGTRLRVTVTANESSDAWRAAEAAIRAVDEVESRLSSWRDESDISRINRADVGQWVEVSQATGEELIFAKTLSRITGGAFNPGVGAMVASRLGRGSGSVAVPDAIEDLRSAVDLENLEIGGGRVRRLQGLLLLDAGAFGKGVALRNAAKFAIDAGADCIDLNFGGQVMRAGSCSESRVLIAHPVDRGLAVAECRLTTGSVATSGNSERGVGEGKDRIGHIIDPRTAHPSPFFGSVTVKSDDPVTADALSTALFVMGAHQGREWMQSTTDLDVEAMWMSSDGEILWSTPDFDADERREKGAEVSGHEGG